MQLLQIMRETLGGARTPDSANLSITDNLDLRIRVALASWHRVGGNEQTFICKRHGGNEWHFRTADLTSRLQFLWWDTGGVESVETADADLPFEDGQTGWVRVRRSGTSVNFWYSESDTNDHTAVTWTPLGTTQTTPAGSIRSTVGTFVVVGTAFAFTGGEALDGYIYTAAVVDNVTTRANPDFTNSAQWTPGDASGTSGVDPQGNTWSLWGGGLIVGDNIPKLPGVYLTVQAAFGSGVASINNQIILSLDWYDITTDTRQISFNRGRMYELDRVDTGTATLELENFDGKYNAHNTASIYYPNVKPNVPIRIRAVYEGQIYPLWSGFVDRWPVSFPGNSNSLVSVSCSDLFKLLAKARVPNPSFPEAVLALTPRAYWRFSSLADSGPEGDHPLTLTATPVQDQPGVWLNDEGFLFDSGTTDMATAADGAVSLDNIGALTLMAWVKPGGFDGVVAERTAGGSGLPTSYALIVGGQTITFSQANTAIIATASFDLSPENLTGEWSHIVVTREPAGNLMLIRCYINGEFFGQQLIGAVPNGTANDTTMGDGFFAGPGDHTLSEVAIWDSVLTVQQINSLYNAQIDDYIVQRTDERITYLFGQSAVINGEPFTDLDLDVGASNMSTDDTDPSSLLDALQQVVDTERGLAFMTGAGVYRFQNRYYRLTQQSTPIATLDEDVYTTPTIGNDDDLLANDISVTPGDGTPRIARDDTSIGENGRGSLDVTIYPADENEALDHAYYLLGLYSEPIQRLEALDFQMDETKPLEIILGAELSNRYNVEVPLAGDDLDVDVYLERIEHTIDLSHHWTVSWQLSHAGPESAFWLLGVPGFSELGTTTKLGF